MPITPDTKDWTWVLSEPCPECGFEAARTTPATVATTIPALLPRWQAVLQRQAADQRPNGDTWSPLEYACHVRDVFEVFDSRLALMLQRKDPDFPNWDQDQAAVDSDYGNQDPARVAAELFQAGNDVSSSFAAVTEDQWERTGRRSDGSRFTVHTLAGYFLHDVIHHLHDVNG